MNINIITIGKIKEQFFREAIEEYLKRLSRFCKIEIIELPETKLLGNGIKEIEKVVQSESKLIMDKLCGYTIALDLQGKMVSSMQIANTIATKAVGGVSEISFIIGGSNGLSRALISKVNESFCFGNITFPHQLMRVILLEQIYRAFMINNGAEYHK